jgi:hypothetical protein
MNVAKKILLFLEFLLPPFHTHPLQTRRRVEIVKTGIDPVASKQRTSRKRKPAAIEPKVAPTPEKANEAQYFDVPVGESSPFISLQMLRIVVVTLQTS